MIHQLLKVIAFDERAGGKGGIEWQFVFRKSAGSYQVAFS